jgi:LPS-assembly lipoprotein
VTRSLLLAIALLTLSGCALRPLYGGGTSGAVASTLRQVSVTTIPGRDGWLVYNKLRERLGTAGEGPAVFRLEVELDNEIIGLGIRGDRAVTRERRILRARFRLVEIANGQVVLDATTGSDAGIDVVSSEYATVAAEQTALEHLAGAVADQIVARIALYATRTPGLQ